MGKEDIERIEELIKNIYSGNKFPKIENLVINEEYVKEIYHKILENCETNVSFVICPECKNCYWIFISESKDIPIIPLYHENRESRKLWIKKYGSNHYQMNISFSRLGKIVLIYWSKYLIRFFLEFSKKVFNPPNILWESILNKLKIILNENEIFILPSSMVYKKYSYRYENEEGEVDNAPPLYKLLFCDELH